MKKILVLAFLLLSVEPSFCEQRWVQPPAAAREVEQPFFENLTLEHCKENSKYASCDELLKRERESRDNLPKDWHYYSTQERLKCIAASPFSVSSGMPYSLQLQTCLAALRSSQP